METHPTDLLDKNGHWLYEKLSTVGDLIAKNNLHHSDLKIETPSEDYSVQYLSPKSALFLAFQVGDRFPTDTEWEYAANKYGKGKKDLEFPEYSILKSNKSS